MKRLLCILNNMNIGGAETFLMKVYRTIDRTEYQMDFCVNYSGKCDYEDEILEMGGRFFRITPKSDNSKEFKNKLTAIIKENAYKDVLRITSNAAGFWDLKIAKKAGATHTCARSSNADDGSLVQNIINRLGRFLWMKYVDVKIAPSDLAAKYTFGERLYNNGAVGILNNGLDLSEFSYSDEARNNIRKEFKIKDSTVVVGHIGRFNYQKNHSFLLNVFNRFHSEVPDSALLLAGSGDLEAQTKAQAKSLGLSDCVIFAGVRRDVPALLSAMDVFLLPSFYEGMPNVVIEAQACGVPCILSENITKEADLSGKLLYLPVSDETIWAAQAKRLAENGRISADLGDYDISAVSARFCKYCFSDEGANS